VEIASNDGYLLQYFRDKGVPVLGIEPAVNVAKVAEEKGVPTRVTFFGAESARTLAAEGLQADLLAGNNVYAHVPNLHSFTEGLRLALKPSGVITLEFPHLVQMLRHNQFDTIYHEHFSYLSLLVVERIFGEHGLVIFDVDELNSLL
jgi:2-polyprenyl-3-methyl-5-hydroxy-6-metoxy-1,4-benzoquinol methylase